MSVLPRDIPVTAATAASDDYVQLDGATNRSRKFRAVEWAPKASPVFTGTPTALTPTGSTPKALVTVDYLPTAMAVAAVRDAAYLALMQLVYPVGEVLITKRTGNPSTWLGFGTWEAYAKGEALVGYDAGDADFLPIGKQGGTKTAALAITNLPDHVHVVPGQSISTSSVGDHAHEVPHNSSSGSFIGLVPDTTSNPGLLSTTTTSSAGGHSHTVEIASVNTSSTTGASATAFSILQPYRVLAVWLRTA